MKVKLHTGRGGTWNGLITFGAEKRRGLRVRAELIFLWAEPTTILVWPMIWTEWRTDTQRNQRSWKYSSCNMFENNTSPNHASPICLPYLTLLWDPYLCLTLPKLILVRVHSNALGANLITVVSIDTSLHLLTLKSRDTQTATQSRNY